MKNVEIKITGKLRYVVLEENWEGYLDRQDREWKSGREENYLGCINREEDDLVEPYHERSILLLDAIEE